MSFTEKIEVLIESVFDASGFDRLNAELGQTMARFEAMDKLMRRGKGIRGFRNQAGQMQNVLNEAGLQFEMFDEQVANLSDAQLEAGFGGQFLKNSEMAREQVQEFGGVLRDAEGRVVPLGSALQRVADAQERIGSGTQIRRSFGQMRSPAQMMEGGFDPERFEMPDIRSRGIDTANRALLSLGVSAEVVENSMNKGNSAFSTFRSRLGTAAGSISSDMVPSLRNLQMTLLGVQFQLLSLAFIFGGLMGSALGAVGVFEILGNTLRMFFLPAALDILPIALDIQDALLGVDEETRRLIGRVFFGVAAFAALGSILAFTFNGFLSVLTVVKGLGAALGTAIKFVSSFLGLGSTWSGILMSIQSIIAKLTGTVLTGFSAAAGVLAGVASGFLIVTRTATEFGRKAAAAVATVLVVLGAIVAFFINIPIVVAAAIGLIIGAILGLAWTFRKELMGAAMWVFKKIAGFIGWVISAFNGFINFIVNDVVGAFVELYKKVVGNSIIPEMVKGIIDWLFKLPRKAFDMATQMIDNIVKGIKGAGSRIWDAFKKVLPDFLVDALEGAGQAVKSSVKGLGGLGESAVNATRNAAGGVADTVSGINPLGGDGGGGQGSVQNNNINANVNVKDSRETPEQTGRKLGQGLSQGLNNQTSNISSGT